jgi:hypothetical protein
VSTPVVTGRCVVSRRNVTTISIVVIVVIAGCVFAAVYVPPLFQRTPAIEPGAVGVWRTTGLGRTYELRIARDTQPTGRVWYRVVFTRDSRFPSSASLDGNAIVVWGENAMSDPRWRITYDADADKLLLEQPRGHEVYGFRRVSSPR